MDRGAWWATVHGVTNSDTTKWLTFSLHLRDQETGETVTLGQKMLARIGRLYISPPGYPLYTCGWSMMSHQLFLTLHSPLLPRCPSLEDDLNGHPTGYRSGRGQFLSIILRCHFRRTTGSPRCLTHSSDACGARGNHAIGDFRSPQMTRCCA